MLERDALIVAITSGRHVLWEAEAFVKAYTHALAQQQRNWDAEAEGYTDPQMAVYAVADLIDPETDDEPSAGPARPDEEPT